MCGTQGYLAPELLRLLPRRFQTRSSDEFTYALDIWSLGCLVHELLTLETPFRESQTNEDWEPESGFTILEPQVDMAKLYEYCHGKCGFPVELLQSSHVGKEGIEFVMGLLAANPNERPVAATAVQHPWLARSGYVSSWFTGLRSECRELGIDLYFGSRQDETLMRRFRTRDIANYVRNVRPGDAPLTAMLGRALRTQSHLVASMLVNSRIRGLEDPTGKLLKDLFELGVCDGQVVWTKLVLPGVTDVNVTFRDGRTGLQVAVQNGHIGVTKLLLECGANPSISKDGQTVLQVAVENQHIDMVQLLLHWNADADHCLSAGDVITAFRTAIGNEGKEVVELLLANKVAVDTRVGGRTFLQMAVENSQTRIVKLLLEKNANVKLACEDGRTPLETTARNGCIDIVKLLLDNKACCEIEENPQLAFRAAVAGGYTEIVQLLLCCRVDVNAEQATFGIIIGDVDRTALQTAAARGYLDIVQLLLDNHADVNAGRGSHTALLAAVEARNTDIVKMLLDHKADPDPRPCGTNNRTIIQVAVEQRDIAMVEMLLANDVSLNSKAWKENSRTVLDTAVVNGDIDILKLLFQHGADIKVGTGVRAPLISAVQSNRIDIVQLLLDNKADINEKHSDQLPLEAAATLGYIEIMKLLLANNADVTGKSSLKGFTALHGAARNGHTDPVRLLLRKNVDVNATSSGMDSWTALNEAAWNGHIDIVQLLIKNKANVNPVPLGRRRTPLRCAAEQGHTHIVELLLSSNVDVNTQSPPGEWTALHAAAMSGNTETVALLLEHKSDINAKSVNGQTALQMAVQSGNKATV